MSGLGEKRSRGLSIAFFLATTFLVVGVLDACRSTSGIHPAGSSFFPLSKGNVWVFAERADNPAGATVGNAQDTIRIDKVHTVSGRRFYHLTSNWPGIGPDLWLTRADNGDILWTENPGEETHPFLLFSEDVGETWSTGLPMTCLDSLRMWDDYAIVDTPYGRFDGVHEIGDIAACADFGWGVSTARGVGPVRWLQISFVGVLERVLVSARVQDDSPAQQAGQPPSARLVNSE